MKPNDSLPPLERSPNAKPSNSRLVWLGMLVFGGGAAIFASAYLSQAPFTTCVARGTLVRTPTGRRAVEDLRVGDVVLSVDPITALYVPATIQAIATAVREVTTLRGGSRRLTATLDHPVYDPRQRRYRQLRDWCEGAATDLLTPGAPQPTATVDEIATRRGAVQVYDITLDGHLHNFVANGIVVHNKSPVLEPPSRCEGVRICYPPEAEPTCASANDCGSKARASYDLALKLAEQDAVDAPYQAYKEFDRAIRYLDIARLDPPATMTDVDERRLAVETKLQELALEHRIRHHQLQQRKMHRVMAQNVQTWQAAFPDSNSLWYQEAKEVERRMKDSGTWPEALDPPND